MTRVDDERQADEWKNLVVVAAVLGDAESKWRAIDDDTLWVDLNIFFVAVVGLLFVGAKECA